MESTHSSLDALAMIPDPIMDPRSITDTCDYLEDLKVSNPILFRIIADGAKELSALPGAEAILTSYAQPHEAGKENNINMADTLHSGDYFTCRGVYSCIVCAKQHDRRSRAIACENSHLGRKPYRCRGQCGTSTWYVWPRRARVPLYILTITEHIMIALRHTPLRNS